MFQKTRKALGKPNGQHGMTLDEGFEAHKQLDLSVEEFSKASHEGKMRRHAWSASEWLREILIAFEQLHLAV